MTEVETEVEKSLKYWAEAIGVPFGTVRFWAYTKLRLKSPFDEDKARKIAAQGLRSTSRARGHSKKEAIANRMKCLQFLGEDCGSN